MTLPRTLTELDTLRAALDDYRGKLADALEMLAEVSAEHATTVARLVQARGDAEAARWLLEDVTADRNRLRRHIETLTTQLSDTLAATYGGIR